jgi:hypothetical protein
MMHWSERNSPTLWPNSPNEKTSLEIAIEVREEENRLLKNLVRRLSEIILKDTAGKK